MKPWLEKPLEEGVEDSREEDVTRAMDPVTVELSLEPRSGETPVRVVTGAGYAGAMIAAGEWNQGARLDLGIVVGGYLGVRVSYRVLQAVEMDAPDADLSLSRWPLEATLEGILPLGRFDLGLAAGVIIDMTAVRGLTGSSRDETEIVGAGLAVGIFGRVRLNEWLAAFVEGGVHAFKRGRNYRWNGENQLVYRPVHPTFTAGLALFLPVRRGSETPKKEGG